MTIINNGGGKPAPKKPADKPAAKNDSKTEDTPIYNKVEIKETSASAPNATSVSAPHIVQYPRPPKRDDGRWLALSSVIGNIIGKLSSQKVIKEAKSAENKWRDVMAKMKEMADTENARVPKLRDKADVAMDDLDRRNTINWQRGDTEYAYGEQLKPCINDKADEICQLSACGWQTDYDGILTRVTADAEAAAHKEMDKICRMNNRYNTGWNCDVRGQLAVATQNTIISQTNKLREEERLKKLQYDTEIKMKTFELMEKTRQNRATASRTYDTTAIDVRLKQYGSYMSDAQTSLKLGADLLSSHGQNAAWLADSLRKTAKESMADWGVLATMITGLLFAWNSKPAAAQANDCGGGGGQSDKSFDALF